MEGPELRVHAANLLTSNVSVFMLNAASAQNLNSARTFVSTTLSSDDAGPENEASKPCWAVEGSPETVGFHKDTIARSGCFTYRKHSQLLKNVPQQLMPSARDEIVKSVVDMMESARAPLQNIAMAMLNELPAQIVNAEGSQFPSRIPPPDRSAVILRELAKNGFLTAEDETYGSMSSLTVEYYAAGETRAFERENSILTILAPCKLACARLTVTLQDGTSDSPVHTEESPNTQGQFVVVLPGRLLEFMMGAVRDKLSSGYAVGKGHSSPASSEAGCTIAVLRVMPRWDDELNLWRTAAKLKNVFEQKPANGSLPLPPSVRLGAVLKAFQAYDAAQRQPKEKAGEQNNPRKGLRPAGTGGQRSEDTGHDEDEGEDDEQEKGECSLSPRHDRAAAIAGAGADWAGESVLTNSTTAWGDLERGDLGGPRVSSKSTIRAGSSAQGSSTSTPSRPDGRPNVFGRGSGAGMSHVDAGGSAGVKRAALPSPSVAKRSRLGEEEVAPRNTSVPASSSSPASATEKYVKQEQSPIERATSTTSSSPLSPYLGAGPASSSSSSSQKSGPAHVEQPGSGNECTHGVCDGSRNWRKGSGRTEKNQTVRVLIMHKGQPAKGGPGPEVRLENVTPSTTIVDILSLLCEKDKRLMGCTVLDLSVRDGSKAFSRLDGDNQLTHLKSCLVEDNVLQLVLSLH